ncbi:RNA-guided endonuclease InsQ/TnpB family protein [Actinomadura sp. 1N219]|uniref:RNA-guided endonuclease InsQ/TnpB family protein n=1 Tax=Actinomadura sp. 1N219 TaxID=3375152 RepID=UPI0037AB7CA4
MRRSFRFLLRPTARQAGTLAACLEDHRQLYNAALEHRRTAYRAAGVTVRYGDQSAELKEVRRADPGGQGRWSAGSQQQTLRRLERAFAAFFRRVKDGRCPGYPRFKGRGRFDTIEWPARKNGACWDSRPHEPATRVYLLGVGHVRVHQHRPVAGTVKTISVKREGARWFVILSCEDVPAQPLPATGAAVGVDLGVASLVTTSGGKHLANPRHLRSAADRLAAAQRDLARCERGSNRRRRAVRRVAALHARVRRQRLDTAHKTALRLVRDHDVIVHEDLRIANMIRSASGTIDEPGRRVAAKSGLNRSILDAGWGVILTVLAHKAESAGRELIAVNPANTSHADVNAAINILRAGLALREAAEAA